MALLSETMRDDRSGRPDDAEEVQARNYFLVVLCALALILIMLLRRGYGIASLVPVPRASSAWSCPGGPCPSLPVFSLAAILFRHGSGWLPDVVAEPQSFSLSGWLLSAATLAYCAAVFRLQGFMSTFFPADVAKKFRPASGPARLENRRNAELVPPEEIAWLIVSVPIFALLAQIAAWFLSHLSEGWTELDQRIFQAIALTWILILAVGFIAGLLGLVQWRRMSPLEAKIYLQDTVWYETRREQRRLQRWLVWLRRKTRKEQ